MTPFFYKQATPINPSPIWRFVFSKIFNMSDFKKTYIYKTFGRRRWHLTDTMNNPKTDEALSLFSLLRPEFQDYALDQIKKLVELQEKN